MGTVTAQTILDKAAILLADISNVRWTRAELLSWLNDGQKQIVILSPNATNKVGVMPLVPGTKQSIPTDGWALLEIIRYMGTDGTKPGRAVRLASRGLIDSFNPNWHTDLPSTIPKHYIFDIQDQTSFFVYPPSNGRGYVQVNYSPVPVKITSESTAIEVNDIFEPILLDYIMYRACSKDAEYAPGLNLAAGYLQTFMASMAQKSQAELSNNPNQQFATKVPNNPGAQS